MRVTCVCGYPKEDSECEVVEVTAEERRVLLEEGKKPESKYYWCKPCHRALADPETMARFMRNSYEQQLRQLGVPQPRQKADEYHQKLLELCKK